MSRPQRRSTLGGMALLAMLTSMTMPTTFVGTTPPRSAGRSDVTAARASAGEKMVALRMKHKGMSSSDIMKATALDAAALATVIDNHKIQTRVLKPVVKRLAEKGMAFEDLVAVTDLPEWAVKEMLKSSSKKTKSPKKAKKAAAPVADLTGSADAATPQVAASVESTAEAAAATPAVPEGAEAAAPGSGLF
eukprot:TRINITY_DN12885_c0_g1_i1.p1 TRINITY_DN12885_c0_g1~~TRINITY_DN12885_c0_g1_i1.p1  ORF type:complete len:191 (-),score=59.39 TRINITY_DN12885_c0_g1_i1:277-849(-)